MVFKNISKKSLGYSLVEILIAIVIASIGLLGIAGSIASSLKSNQGAVQRSAAVAQAYSIIEMMRADKSNAVIGNYNLNNWTCSRVAGDNSIGQRQNIWINGLKDGLGPTACGKISCNSASCVVSIRWDNTISMDTNADETTQSSSDKYVLKTRI